MSRRAYMKRKRAQQRKVRKLIAALLMAMVVVMIMTVGIAHHSVAANDTPARVKYYTHIVVKQGDTLWNIAERYYSDEYKDYKSYMAEVRKINHLETNRIFTGHTLVVPYYAAADHR